jgi:hypothetical protein
MLQQGRSRSGIGNPFDAFLEALQSLAQPFAQFRQPLGAKQQKRNHGQHDQVPRLK